MTDVDRAYDGARRGDRRALVAWMGLVEMSLRRSLRRFARAIDVEAAMQETLLRMMLVIRDPERVLAGENASLRFAARTAVNVAREEIRRLRHDRLVRLEELDGDPGPAVEPEPPSDPGLRRALEACLEEMPGRPGRALRARLRRGHLFSDRDLARSLDMRKNTFLQNIVRARRFLARCLEGRGILLREVLP